ncbi:MAG: 3-carboxy-cis,cis-muconate cycloisomerase, partial [Frankiaceae bacterium]|nr:3-carboxy-cis,cis-muconate cycloisomerase [Frankiaceae bacterium]
SEDGGGLFGGVLARGAVARAVGDRAWLQAMLDFEAALARAEARAGLIGDDDARAITQAADADAFDIDAIGAAAAATARSSSSPVCLMAAIVRRAGARSPPGLRRLVKNHNGAAIRRSGPHAESTTIRPVGEFADRERPATMRSGHPEEALS